MGVSYVLRWYRQPVSQDRRSPNIIGSCWEDLFFPTVATQLFPKVVPVGTKAHYQYTEGREITGMFNGPVKCWLHWIAKSAICVCFRLKSVFL